MRVLYIDVNCKYTSTGQIVYSLFSECKKHGIESAVCYGRGPKIKETGIFKFGIDIETYLHALLTRLTGYTGCYSYFSTKRLIRYIKKFNPDIVHIHELHAYFVNIKPLLTYLRKKGTGVVFTNHCEFLYTGKCGYSKSCNRFQTTCGKCPLLRDYPSSLIFDHTSYMLKVKRKLLEKWNSSIIVSPSSWLNKKAEQSFLKTSNKKVIHNGIDTSIYNVVYDRDVLEKYHLPPDKVLIISVAPDIFSSNKGGHRFLDIASKFISDESIHFVTVGAINNLPTSTLENVTVLPLIKDKTELTVLYSMSKCFVICSNYENFPTTSLEAQCCGTKVVGYDVGGVKETILEGNGFVVPFNDSEAAKKCIQDIINEDYSKAEVSHKAIEYFSSQRMFLEYFDLYKKLCD